MFVKGNAVGFETRFGDSWPGQRCGAKTRSGNLCQRPAYKTTGKCKLHGGVSTGARTPEGLQRISEANLKHGRMTKEKLATQRHLAAVSRSLRAEIKRIETALINAGLMPFD